MSQWQRKGKVAKPNWEVESDSQQLREVLGEVNEEQLSLPQWAERNTGKRGSRQWQPQENGERKGRGKGSNAT